MSEQEKVLRERRTPSSTLCQFLSLCPISQYKESFNLILH